MHFRVLAVLCCTALLAACGSDQPKTEQVPAPAPAKVAKKPLHWARCQPTSVN